MEITAKWNHAGKWKDFDIADINHMPRSHAINLFTRGIKIVIRQDQIIVSNDMDMRNLYRKKGHRVIALDKLQHSNDKLQEVGFI